MLLAACAGLGAAPEEVVTPPAVSASHEGLVLDFARPLEDSLVQLHARESFYVGRWALHPWFLAYDAAGDTWEQWEVWAGDLYGYYRKPQPGKRHYSDGRPPQEVEGFHAQHGAVRCWSELTFLSDGSRGQVLGQWTGADAERILAVLRRPEDYPWRDLYHVWPGPNSNGFVMWVLRQAEIPFDPDPRMVGKDWTGAWGLRAGLSPARTGLQFDLPLLGAAAGLREGFELHLLGATLGLDLWPPALKTPFGRLGWPE